MAIFFFKTMSLTLNVTKLLKRMNAMTKQPKKTGTVPAVVEEPKHLYLMRHGKASKKEKYLDAERPLAKRGRKDVKKTEENAARYGIAAGFDLVFLRFAHTRNVGTRYGCV